MSNHLTEEELLALVREQRAPVTAPPELWPLVATSTIHLRAVRRHVLRSLRGILLLAAVLLIAATAIVTWHVERWTHVPQPPASGTGGGAHAGHAGHPTARTGRRPQDGPPAPPRPPQAPRPAN